MSAFPVLFAICLSACAGSPGTGVPPPAWVQNPESVYPGERFIAVTGRGADRRVAEITALAGSGDGYEAVFTEATATGSAGTLAASTGMTRGLTEETFVNSEVSLFAVRYTAAWRDSAAKEYVCAACIDRDEAWAIYEPRLHSLTGPFTAAYQATEAESDSVLMALRYFAALKIASGKGLSAAMDFVDALAPRKAGVFDQVRKNLAETPQKIADAKALSPMSVRCDNDADGIITVAITGVFAAVRFPYYGHRTDGAPG